MSEDTNSRTELAASVGAFALAWLAGVAGLFSAFDGVLYDRFTRLASRWRQEPVHTLLVDLPAEGAFGPQDVSELVSKLGAQGARALGFAQLPAAAARAATQLRTASVAVVLARPVLEDADDPSRLQLAPLPSPGLGAGDWGVSDLADEGPVLRTQRAWFHEGPNRFASFELQIAGAALGRMPQVPDRYWIRFRGGPGSLPRMPASQILSGGVPAELVRGKVVLAGPRWQGAGAAIATASCAPGERMAWLECHGQALETLMLGAPIRAAGPGASAAILLAAALATGLILRRLGPAGALAFTLAASAAHAGAAALLLAGADYWLAPVPGLTAQLLAHLAMVRVRGARSAAALSRLHVSASMALQAGPFPEAASDTRELRSRVIVMVNQTLELRRTAVFERRSGSPLLSLAEAVGVSSESLQGLTLDARRDPFIQAAGRHRPVRLQAFGKDTEPGRLHYLVELAHLGEELGFWYASLDAAYGPQEAMLETQLAAYGAQISELLFVDRQSRQRLAAPGLAAMLLGPGRDEQVHRAVRQTFALLEDRLRRIRSVLTGSSTRVIVYDLFGRVLEVSGPMLALLADEGVRPGETSAVDLLVRLSGQELTKAREAIRFCVFERTPLSFPAVLATAPGRTFMLHVRSLEQESARAETGLPGVLGIGFEVVETTALTRMRLLRADLASGLGTRLRNELTGIELSASLLTSAKLDEEKMRYLCQTIHSKVGKALKVQEESIAYLTSPAETIEQHERYPVDVKAILAAELETLRPQAAKREIALEVDQPAVMGQVLASPGTLTLVLRSMLAAVLHDTPDRAAMTIAVHQGAARTCVQVRSAGFGIPSARLKEFLASPTPLESPDLEGLRRSIGWARTWDGVLEATSDVGQGMDVTLQLRRFL